jgi:putative Holliday junction resolvase
VARILAIDYGLKRTGIAVTDELQIIASGLTTVPTNDLIPFLKDYISREKVEGQKHKDNFYHTLEVVDNIAQ